MAFTCTTAPRDKTPPTYWRDLLGFLRHLPKLTTLRLKNLNRLESVVPGLSPSLRVLELDTLHGGLGPLCDDHIHQLAQLCPLIEDLALEIRRSRGDAAEVSRYRAIGRLPRLQRLRIHLDASPPMPFALGSGAGGSGSTIDIEQQSSYDTTIEPWFDELDTRRARGPLRLYRRGHIRDVLVNSAIDAALARSIWTVIQDSKRSTPLSGTAVLRPLERLELCTVRDDMFPLPCAVLLRYFSALRRRWVVERDVRDDARDVLHVVQVDAGAHREWFMEDCCIPTKGKRHVLEIWRREWLAKGEGSDWWEDWESRPLCLE